MTNKVFSIYHSSRYISTQSKCQLFVCGIYTFCILGIVLWNSKIKIWTWNVCLIKLHFYQIFYSQFDLIILLLALCAVVFLWNMYHSISQKAPSPGYHVINVVINLLLSIHKIESDNIKTKINIGQNYKSLSTFLSASMFFVILFILEGCFIKFTL